MNISDEMVKNLKAEVRKKLKEESKVTASMKKQLQALREEEKILFKGYVQGKCNEEMYNEMKAEIAEKRDALQKTMERYNATDTEIDDICEKIIDVTVNAGKILKSPIISLKRDFLRLILSDFFTDRKNVVFSIVKPFDKLLRTAQINKWCAFVLRLCARVSHSASFAIAQDLGRFFQSASSILHRLHSVPRFRTENFDDYKQLDYKLELL